MVTRLKENDLYNVDRRVWMVRVLTTVLTETEKVPAWTLDKFEPGASLKFGTADNLKSQVEDLYKFLHTLGTGGKGKSTWINRVHRQNLDLRGNWLAKELNRSGTQGKDSKRRMELYAQRKQMRNYDDMKILWHKCPSRCALSGQLINYGLGIMKSIIDNLCLKLDGRIGVSPSIERINPELGYTMSNVEIISNFENIGRNLGIDCAKMREERKLLDSMKTHGEGLMTIEEYEKG